MPLTVPAHQLLVLPLCRGRAFFLPGSALLLGTMLPDLAFLIGGYGLNITSHLWYGPLVFAPTLGLLLYVWGEALFVPALAQALPSRGRWPLARLCTTRGLPRSAAGWLWAVVALAIGAYSHVFFDGWTHSWMWPARALYRHHVVDVPGFGVTNAAHSLQGVASVIASLIVVSWAHQRMRRAPEGVDTPDWRRHASRLGLGILLGSVLGFAVGVGFWGWPETSRKLVFLIMSPAALGAFCGATVVAWQLRTLPATRT